jgi:hypothetical protein
MMIIGCDFHPSWQQIAWLDTETGETGEQKLVHADGDAERFYRQLPAPALIGMEATGNSFPALSGHRTSGVTLVTDMTCSSAQH